MPKSGMLRVSDVCAAYRIIGDCRDVGGDPSQWEQLALEGMCRLAGGFAAAVAKECGCGRRSHCVR